MKGFIITIARGYGSSGKEIGSRLAAHLGIKCYENRILTLASQLSGLTENRSFDLNEKLETTGVFAKLLAGLPHSRRPNPIIPGAFVSNDKLFACQKDIILNLAETESCVIIGKCADWILRDHMNVVSVYIEAPRRYCLRRIMEKMDVDEETANRSITETDKYRAEYYAHYTGNYWTNPVNYDITLNSERLGISGCVEMIYRCLLIKFPNSDLPVFEGKPIKAEAGE